MSVDTVDAENRSSLRLIKCEDESELLKGSDVRQVLPNKLENGSGDHFESVSLDGLGVVEDDNSLVQVEDSVITLQNVDGDQQQYVIALPEDVEYQVLEDDSLNGLEQQIIVCEDGTELLGSGMQMPLGLTYGEDGLSTYIIDSDSLGDAALQSLSFDGVTYFTQGGNGLSKSRIFQIISGDSEERLVTRREKDRVRKQVLRMNPNYREKEKEQSRLRMRKLRRDPEYRQRERDRDCLRRRLSRREKADQRQKEKEKHVLQKRLLKALTSVYDASTGEYRQIELDTSCAGSAEALAALSGDVHEVTLDSGLPREVAAVAEIATAVQEELDDHDSESIVAAAALQEEQAYAKRRRASITSNSIGFSLRDYDSSPHSYYPRHSNHHDAPLDYSNNEVIGFYTQHETLGVQAEEEVVTDETVPVTDDGTLVQDLDMTFSAVYVDEAGNYVMEMPVGATNVMEVQDVEECVH